MNVNDVKDMTAPEGDRLEAIFARQKELMEKYHEIEIRNGVGYGLLTGPFDINDMRSQELVKNFAWRVVEELTEATECLAKNSLVEEDDIEHFREEVADAFHFLVEMAILLDITPQFLMEGHTLPPVEGNDKLDEIYRFPFTRSGPYMIIQQLGLAMNCLKQKPWKQTHFLTDKTRLRKFIRWTFYAFGNFCREEDLSPEMLFDYYFRKSEVNKFRQRSQY